MTSDPQILMEITFNLIYLGLIWLLVVVMTYKMGTVKEDHINIAKRFRLAFFLLALGDSGHVGFRVIAFLRGGLDKNSTMVGLGTLSTAITLTFFYMVLLDIWRVNFNKDKDLLFNLLMVSGVIRLILMIFPQNQWGNVVPPFEWGVLRSIPLIILGITVAILMLWDGYKINDTRYKNISYSILASYIFYLPVIFFVQRIPIIGMLMIPKTIMYLVMAWLAYRYYFS